MPWKLWNPRLRTSLLLAVLLPVLGVSASLIRPRTAGLIGPTQGHAQESDKPIRALLVLGGCCHDYARQKDALTKGISVRTPVEWVVAYEPSTSTSRLNPVYEKADWAKGFDVVVHDECTSDVKDLDTINRILEPHRQGLPAVILHCGMHSYRSEGWPRATPWFEFTGCPSTAHGPQEPISVKFVDRDNPITRGLADWKTVNEELYNNSAGKILDTAKPLARGSQTYQQRGREVTVEHVVAWTNTYNGKTRVFATTLGHNTATVEDPKYLDLVTRGLLWSVGRLKDR
jgi:type 1 glutamine amidotransferase